MADQQTLRQIAQTRTPFSAWLGVMLLFFMFGLIVFAIVGPAKRGSDFEQKRATERLKKLKAQREQDAAALTGYAWVDKNKGTVRIPIDRAMEVAMAELAQKKPAAAGPITTPAPAAAPAGAPGIAASPAAGAPPASPVPSGTPKTAEKPAAGTNPPNAAPGSQPGASATPAASPASAAAAPASPPPAVATPTPEGSPLPVRGKSPEGQ